MNNFIVFVGRSNPDLGNKICESMEISPGKIELSNFPDGEIRVKIHDDVRGRECFIIQSVCPPVNENLMELLITIHCLKRASATSVTAVLPYFGYARQDRKAEGRTPITARLVADLIDTSEADRVLTMDLHALQIEGFFSMPVDHLRALPIFVPYFRQNNSLSNTFN